MTNHEGTCPACGKTIENATKPGFKRDHFLAYHPEMRFTRKYTNLVCRECASTVSSFPLLVKHYKSAHGWKPSSAQSGPVIVSDSKVVDSFFEQLGDVLVEVKTLRAERAEWQARAARWAEKVIELQNIMARPS